MMMKKVCVYFASPIIQRPYKGYIMQMKSIATKPPFIRQTTGVKRKPQIYPQ